jgi:hypothetical protein
MGYRLQVLEILASTELTRFRSSNLDLCASQWIHAEPKQFSENAAPRLIVDPAKCLSNRAQLIPLGIAFLVVEAAARNAPRLQ